MKIKQTAGKSLCGIVLLLAATASPMAPAQGESLDAFVAKARPRATVDSGTACFPLARSAQPMPTQASPEACVLAAAVVYLNVRHRRALAQLAADNVAPHNNLLRLVEEQYAGGRASLSDIYLSDLARAEATLVKEQADDALDEAKLDYQLLSGRAPDTLVQVDVPADRFPASLEVALAMIATKEADDKSSSLTPVEHEIEMRRAWAAWQRTSQQLIVYREAVLLTQKLRDAYLKQFEIGQRSLISLLDIFRTHFEVQRNILIAEHEAELARLRVVAIAGKLSAALGLK